MPIEYKRTIPQEQEEKSDNIREQLNDQKNNPLHGVKLVDILERLKVEYGWEELGLMTGIRCFSHDPTIKSALKFLRTTAWARDKVERIYVSLVT